MWTKQAYWNLFHFFKIEAVDSDIVFSCVGNDLRFERYNIGKDKAFSAMKAGSIFIDHTTTSSDIAIELSKKALKP